MLFLQFQTFSDEYGILMVFSILKVSAFLNIIDRSDYGTIYGMDVSMCDNLLALSFSNYRIELISVNSLLNKIHQDVFQTKSISK